jgi:hypothetical protein
MEGEKGSQIPILILPIICFQIPDIVSANIDPFYHYIVAGQLRESNKSSL